jgi:tellurite methyltransferase
VFAVCPGSHSGHLAHICRWPSRAGGRVIPNRKAAAPLGSPRRWAAYYRWTSKRPPRELVIRVLDHLTWEGKENKPGTAIDLGCGAGNDSLELLRRGWNVLAIDGQEGAVKFLERRVPPRLRSSLTCLVDRMEDLELPRADLIYASFSLPFCTPAEFPTIWSKIRSAIRPGGHFAGQLFGNLDEWNGRRPMCFHTVQQVRTLSRGFKLELLRETSEAGNSFDSPKHWHYFDLILGKPPMRAHRFD